MAIFDPDQLTMLELLLDKQSTKIVGLISSELEVHLEKCTQTRACKGMDLTSFVTKEAVDVEKLLSFKNAPKFWVGITLFILFVVKVSNTESITNIMIAIGQRLLV